MRLFKRSSVAPPQLVRLSMLVEGGEAMDGTATPGARLSLPSCFSECNIEDLMASTGTPKIKRGFPFPWLSRKQSAPKKYAVSSAPTPGGPEPMRSAVSQLSLVGDAQRWTTAAYPSLESLRDDDNDFLNNNAPPRKGDMYRSVSTSALLEEPPPWGLSLFLSSPPPPPPSDDALRNDCERVRGVGDDPSVASHGGRPAPCLEEEEDDPIDPCAGDRPPGGAPGQSAAVAAAVEGQQQQQQLGTVLEEDAFLDPSVPADAESLASSTQPRSDESGYESDGTGKNGGGEDGPPLPPARSPSESSSHVQRFAALFHRLVSLTDHHEARSLRLRAPGGGRAPPSPTDPSPTKSSSSASARLGQFKAWTLDRKLLRSRWKKGGGSEESGGRRGSIFQPELFPAPPPPPSETRSLPALSDAASGACGDLNYQLRLRKAGYGRSSSSSSGGGTAARRRQWLQSQLQQEPEHHPQPAEEAAADRLPSQLDPHEVLSVELRKSEQGELGIYITGCTDPGSGVLGYVIVDLEAEGPADRSGQLLRGDELLTVNGRRLQGVGLEEARRLLRVPGAEVRLLVARELPDALGLKGEGDEARLPPVPELRESADRCPRLRHWTSDVTPRTTTTPSSSSREGPDSERAGLCGGGGASTLPRRPRSSQLSLRAAAFEKGPGRKSLGFSIVGGSDSPRGRLGFYVKTIFAGGQAAETGCLREGDEIYTLNGQSLQGLSHSEAIAAFKRIKAGPVLLHIGRRTGRKSSSFCETPSKLESSNSKSCSTLDNI